jgi:hypothetical protein
MANGFIDPNEKARWGIVCTQSADGSLWVGMGDEWGGCGLSEQLGAEIEEAVREALEVGRGTAMGGSG